MEQVSANRYVTMVIYQKLLPRTKKRGVFYFSLKISSLNRLASYDEYPLHSNRHYSTHYCYSLSALCHISTFRCVCICLCLCVCVCVYVCVCVFSQDRKSTRLN